MSFSCFLTAQNESAVDIHPLLCFFIVKIIQMVHWWRMITEQNVHNNEQSGWPGPPTKPSPQRLLGLQYTLQWWTIWMKHYGFTMHTAYAHKFPQAINLQYQNETPLISQLMGKSSFDGKRLSTGTWVFQCHQTDASGAIYTQTKIPVVCITPLIYKLNKLNFWLAHLISIEQLIAGTLNQWGTFSCCIVNL